MMQTGTSTSTKKNIAILGSTGSIGTQTLDVIRANPDSFCVEVLTGNGNADLLIKQALELTQYRCYCR
jgi:1-deoxy-D-xylulose-5-phosphate reductoisomerase